MARSRKAEIYADGNVDWAGALVGDLGLGGLAYGFIESAGRGWSAISVWGALLLGCASLSGFLRDRVPRRVSHVAAAAFCVPRFQRRQPAHIVSLRRSGNFFLSLSAGLIQVQHYSATATGAAALPLILLMFLLSRWSGGLVARYGPRLPLLVGPLIAAAGFLCFAAPSIGGTYWRTFFPAFLVLGFGLAVSVAPLTTVVMNAVDQNRAGAASGINNAVARVAALLAIAVLGVAMTSAFVLRLNRSLAHLALPSSARVELQSSEVRLAALTVPPELDAQTASAIRISVDRAFVFAFRLVMFICAALSLASAAFAWLMVGSTNLSSPRASPDIR